MTMTDHPLDRSPIFRAVHDAVRQAETNDTGVPYDDMAELIIGYPTPSEAEREVVADAVHELIESGILVESHGILHTAEFLNRANTDRGRSDGFDHAAAAVRAVTAADSTTGAPRSIVEATVGEAEVIAALQRGDIYVGGGGRLKVTRRHA